MENQGWLVVPYLLLLGWVMGDVIVAGVRLRKLHDKVDHLNQKVDHLVDKLAPMPKPGTLIFDPPRGSASDSSN